MSFGFSASDIGLLVKLAITTVNNTRRACGEYAEITQEISDLNFVLQRLGDEILRAGDVRDCAGCHYREELALIIRGCERNLENLAKILEKYNALGAKERSVTKLWRQVRFGNGDLVDVAELRRRITYYTSALGLYLNTVTSGRAGRMEKQMSEAGGDLKDIKLALNGIAAHLLSKSAFEGSMPTAYTRGDEAVWQEFCQELVKDSFPSSIVEKYKSIIQAYLKEPGSRRLLNDSEHFQLNSKVEALDSSSENNIVEIRNQARLKECRPCNTKAANLSDSAEVESRLTAPSNQNTIGSAMDVTNIETSVPSQQSLSRAATAETADKERRKDFDVKMSSQAAHVEHYTSTDPDFSVASKISPLQTSPSKTGEDQENDIECRKDYGVKVRATIVNEGISGFDPDTSHTKY